uniref:Uncharacterized protein n=1 Tax=Oryza brachyantha TaxID=4533 RepID=J3N4S0_ORYBR
FAHRPWPTFITRPRLDGQYKGHKGFILLLLLQVAQAIMVRSWVLVQTATNHFFPVHTAYMKNFRRGVYHL